MGISDQVNLNFKLSEVERDAFSRACSANDQTMSQELRKFVVEYIKRNRQGDFFKNEK